MAFSFRLDPDTEARIRRLAKTTGRSKSAVAREAVMQYFGNATAADQNTATALDRLRPFVGIIASGGAAFSTDTHAKFRAVLQRKHRARRSG